jgi:NADH:ubiquinone oxidoreductase subunit
MLNSWGTLLYTRVFGFYVGTDSYCNRYYKRIVNDCEKRWMIYNNRPDARLIPVEWHAWLHFLQDEPPTHSTSYQPMQQTEEKNAETKRSIENIPKTALKCYERWSP